MRKFLSIYLAITLPLFLIADDDAEEENIGTQPESELVQEEEEGKTADWEIAMNPAGIVFAILAVVGVVTSACISDGQSSH